MAVVLEGSAELPLLEAGLALAEADEAVAQAAQIVQDRQKHVAKITLNRQADEHREKELRHAARAQAAEGISINLSPLISVQASLAVYREEEARYIAYDLQRAVVDLHRAIVKQKEATLNCERARREAHELKLLSKLQGVADVATSPVNIDIGTMLASYDDMVRRASDELDEAQVQLHNAEERAQSLRRSYMEKFQNG